MHCHRNPRFRHITVDDISQYILEPLVKDRLVIAKMTSDPNRVGGELVGTAIWANVSDEVDAKIQLQIKGGIYPLRLKPNEWNSGNNNWLLDIIAPNPRLSTTVLANFKQIVKTGKLNVHPIIESLVETRVLKNMLQS